MDSDELHWLRSIKPSPDKKPALVSSPRIHVWVHSKWGGEWQGRSTRHAFASPAA